LVNVNISELENKTMLELYQIAKEINLTGYSKLRKKELIFEITKALTQSDELLHAQGVLEIMPDGYGFLRPFAYLPSQDDIYVSPSQIRKFELRTGDRVAGQVRSPKDNERFYALLKVENVNDFPRRNLPSAFTLMPLPRCIPQNELSWKQTARSYPPGLLT